VEERLVNKREVPCSNSSATKKEKKRKTADDDHTYIEPPVWTQKIELFS
jgi:hypothetical protein